MIISPTVKAKDNCCNDGCEGLQFLDSKITVGNIYIDLNNINIKTTNVFLRTYKINAGSFIDINVNSMINGTAKLFIAKSTEFDCNCGGSCDKCREFAYKLLYKYKMPYSCGDNTVNYIFEIFDISISESDLLSFSYKITPNYKQYRIKWDNNVHIGTIIPRKWNEFLTSWKNLRARKFTTSLCDLPVITGSITDLPLIVDSNVLSTNATITTTDKFGFNVDVRISVESGIPTIFVIPTYTNNNTGNIRILNQEFTNTSYKCEFRDSEYNSYDVAEPLLMLPYIDFITFKNPHTKAVKLEILAMS